jgi:hypothetical protein
MSSKHEEELKAAYLVHPNNNENLNPNSIQPKILSHYNDEEDEVEGEDCGESQGEYFGSPFNNATNSEFHF